MNLNFVILIAKWFIYKTKINKSDLFILDLLAEVKSQAIIESYIQNTKGKECSDVLPTSISLLIESLN